ncbi:uncharacterized protein [Rutidosis leptorrhynchoides]|uniref:uncharacterized protein n=1 Tax=Rutidosis leptorrhynchoides TaxID=125765 RepID=UPI003A99D43B
MNSVRLKWKNKRWNLMFQPYKLLSGLNHSCYRSLSHCTTETKYISGNNFFGLYLPNSSKISGSNSTIYLARSYANSRFYSSENIKDVNQHDAHVRLEEQDQKEWLINERLSVESKRKKSPYLTKRQRFKNKFLKRIIPWEKQTVSWDTFPYYVNENSKNLLVDCVASHLKHKKFTTKYGWHLDSSSERILLRSVSGTELYREGIARALARDLQVPLLILDSNFLAPYDFGDDESGDEHGESGDHINSKSEIDDEASNEEDRTRSNENKSNDENMQAKNVDVVEEIASEPKQEETKSSKKAKKSFKEGDHVIYVGPSESVEGDKRPLYMGQRGEIYEINDKDAAVILDSVQDEQSANPSIYWINLNDIVHDFDTKADCYIAMKALSEVLRSVEPLIVYFQDSSIRLPHAISKRRHKEFVISLEFMFDQISGPVVSICGRNEAELGSKEKEIATMILQYYGGGIANLPLSLKGFNEGLGPTARSEDNDIHKIFTNIISMRPPKDEDLLRVFNKQIDEDRRIVIARSNINELNKVAADNELSCVGLLHVNTDGLVLTTNKAENIVGWAKNHYLSTCDVPSIKSDRLNLPRESLEVGIKRLMVIEEESVSKKPAALNLENLAEGQYERNFISAVVPPGEIGIKFDDIGALEDVKTALHELAILPMKRPELFSRGNLLRPCKGILLFGPPGTGKTLLAKALANEAGANFISVTSATLTSKWYGNTEKLVKGLFSFATKLAPAIIFVDEVDSLLGARGGHEHEATRRMRNEFMAAWDGLRSKDSQRILVLGATNRPFDLDDAVIRRMPRRIYVGLPDTNSRLKILKVLLAKENIESDFDVRSLVNATEGYSGSDLKNLCIAAAYRPVQELLDEEKKGQKHETTPELRLLNLDDFIQSKAKVSSSVSYDAASMNALREWNEEYGEGGSRGKSPFGF